MCQSCPRPLALRSHIPRKIQYQILSTQTYPTSSSDLERLATEVIILGCYGIAVAPSSRNLLVPPPARLSSTCHDSCLALRSCGPDQSRRSRLPLLGICLEDLWKLFSQLFGDAMVVILCVWDEVGQRTAQVVAIFSVRIISNSWICVSALTYSAWLAPCPRCGLVGCAASPTRTQRLVCH